MEQAPENFINSIYWFSYFYLSVLCGLLYRRYIHISFYFILYVIQYFFYIWKFALLTFALNFPWKFLCFVWKWKTNRVTYRKWSKLCEFDVHIGRHSGLMSWIFLNVNYKIILLLIQVGASSGFYSISFIFFFDFFGWFNA